MDGLKWQEPSLLSISLCMVFSQQNKLNKAKIVIEPNLPEHLKHVMS